jgi:Family of unknown function (DUF6262)
MNPSARDRVEQACTELTAAGDPVTFAAVVRRTGLARTTLYRNPTLRAVIDEHRRAGTTTLASITYDIATLQAALETIAARVRHHEEQLRRIHRDDTNPASR